MGFSNTEGVAPSCSILSRTRYYWVAHQTLVFIFCISRIWSKLTGVAKKALHDPAAGSTFCPASYHFPTSFSEAWRKPHQVTAFLEDKMLLWLCLTLLGTTPPPPNLQVGRWIPRFSVQFCHQSYRWPQFLPLQNKGIRDLAVAKLWPMGQIHTLYLTGPIQTLTSIVFVCLCESIPLPKAAQATTLSSPMPSSIHTYISTWPLGAHELATKRPGDL